MKKLLSVLLAILLIVSIVPISQVTVRAATSGHFTYSISGNNAVITDVDDEISGNITVPSTLGGYAVKAIGANAFYDCDNITEITVPDCVITIEEAAFAFCSNLTTIVLPNGMKVINDGVFSDCEKLAEVKIPDAVISIGNLAFSNCASLADIIIPGNVTSIGDYAFSWCSELKGITIPDSVTTIGIGAFSYCQNLEKLSLGDGLKIVQESAFYNCKKISELVIPSEVIKIDYSAFENCRSLKKITLPKTIEIIESYAFNGCDRLADVWYGGSEDNEMSIGHYNECLISAIWHYSMCDKHSYNGTCLLGCVICGWKPQKHFYVNACDTDCNECGYKRSVLTHSYDECFNGYNEELYQSWNITVSKTGVYTLNPNTSYKGTYSYHNIAVFDKQNNPVLYYEKIGGFPLVSGQTYTVKFRYNCKSEINGTIIWKRINLKNTIFPDTNAGEWYNDAVIYSVGRGLISGYGATGLFGTADSIQRQDFLVILARLDGVDLSDYAKKSSKFPDVVKGSYYESAVNWGSENGITTGYENGKFGVGDKITREQLVTFLHRYVDKVKNVKVGYTTAEKNKVKNTYTDYKNVSDYAQAPIIWAVTNGVISGKTPTTIVPGGNALRCEVAKIMYNIFCNDIF